MITAATSTGWSPVPGSFRTTCGAFRRGWHAGRGHVGSTIYAGLVSDGSSLYWFEAPQRRLFNQEDVGHAGSAVTTVVADAVAVGGYGIPPRFTVDDTNVYWLNPPNLYKAPK